MIPSVLWITPPSGALSFMHTILKNSADVAGVAVLHRRPGERVRARLDEALPLRALCRARSVPFLVQDLEMALATGADGVHLPEHGVPVAALRPYVALLGASRHSRAGLTTAFDEGADYCTLSPVFASPGKPSPLGLPAFRRETKGLGPVLALGGIVDKASADAARLHGAAGIATIRGVARAADLQALRSPAVPKEDEDLRSS